jgi:hypothetical protein
MGISDHKPGWYTFCLRRTLQGLVSADQVLMVLLMDGPVRPIAFGVQGLTSDCRSHEAFARRIYALLHAGSVLRPKWLSIDIPLPYRYTLGVHLFIVWLSSSRPWQRAPSSPLSLSQLPRDNDGARQCRASYS